MFLDFIQVLIASNLQTIKIIKHITITDDTLGKTITKILFESSSSLSILFDVVVCSVLFVVKLIFE